MQGRLAPRSCTPVSCTDEFNLTLAPGHRTEALGPFFYSQQKETQRIWAVPPVLSYTRDPGTESKEIDFLYPVITYDRYGEQYRWQLFQILSFAGGPTQQETARDRFTLFPLYFQQRSSEPSENYTAVFPFYGHVKHRLFRDDAQVERAQALGNPAGAHDHVRIQRQTASAPPS